MRILYLSCHSILEYDEVSLLSQFGHEVFSPGAYWKPAEGGDGMRPPLPDLKYDPEIVRKWTAHEQVYPSVDGKSYLTKDIVDHFDCVIVMHVPEWISSNWEAMKHKPVIWRTIGQSVTSTEQKVAPYRARGLKVVRYSPREMNIPHFVGQDALIRFYKDPKDYGKWTGQTERVITFAQSMQQRDAACNYSLFERVTRPFPRALFGPGNTQPGLGYGKVPYERLLTEMRQSRAYFYTGTHPASYTLNFMEAWMTGVPVVAVGPNAGNAAHLRNHDLYEIPDLIQHGVNGFISDDERVLASCVRNLLNSKELAQRISAEGRKSAVRHFSKEMMGASWNSFLGQL